MDEVFVFLLIVVGLTFLGPILFALQGALRDRHRRRVLDRFREQNKGVILLNTQRWPEADPSVAPVLVRANTVRSLDAVRFSLTSLRQIVGGQLIMLTKNLTLARDEATERMRAQAREHGLDAILNVRYETTIVGPMSIEIIATGTAIRRLPS